jgi:MoaA/NifB/PqqE/SkfB family radical SAM enzyme
VNETSTRLTALPMPKADMALYNSILERGLERFPDRRANYERYKAAARGETLDFLPIKLDVENVSRCNFRCNMCQVSQWPKTQRARDLTLDEFKAVVDGQTGLVEIKLQGMGEPLLNATPYFEMIDYARQRDIWVRSTNNGSLLHLNENYKRLIDADICEAQISIDGASQETYEDIRLGGKFARTSKNCEMLNRYARDVGKHRTRMWVVVQEKNFHELEAFPRLAADLGFSRLTLSLDLADWGQREWRESNDRIDRHDKFTVARGLAIAAAGEALGVEVTFWFVDEKYDAADRRKLCPWPFERAYISSDMRVVPCCMIANPEVVDFGDAADFQNVWNGKAIADFRKAHLDGKIPEVCKSCYSQKSAG